MRSKAPCFVSSHRRRSWPLVDDNTIGQALEVAGYLCDRPRGQTFLPEA